MFGTIRYQITTNTAGAALALTDDHNVVHFSSNAGGAVLMTNASVATGQRIVLTMTAFDTDAYTLVVQGGTLTFDAADETAEVYYDGTVFRVLSLNGATVV